MLHGQSNAVFFFQSTVGGLCESLRDHILQWLDDLLFYARDTRQLLTSLRAFFLICRKYGLKLHAKKCKFFLRKVRWCGRIISPEGVRHDPMNMQALKNMPTPVNGEQLQQFICAAGWMRAGIPNFAALTSPLSEALEEVYAVAGRRTRAAASKVLLKATSWNAFHVATFNKIRQALINAVTLAHPDSTKLLCLFTDASETHWGSVLTQIPPVDLDEPVAAQRHVPLAFLSGSFKGSSAR